MAALTQLCLQLMREYTRQIHENFDSKTDSRMDMETREDGENQPVTNQEQEATRGHLLDLVEDQDAQISHELAPISVDFLRRLVRLAHDWGVAGEPVDYRDWLTSETRTLLDGMDRQTFVSELLTANKKAKKIIASLDGWTQTPADGEKWDVDEDADMQAFIERKRQKINESNTREYLERRSPAAVPVVENSAGAVSSGAADAVPENSVNVKQPPANPTTTETQETTETKETTETTETKEIVEVKAIKEVKETTAARATKPSPHLQRSTQIRRENARLFRELNPKPTDLIHHQQSSHSTKREFCSYPIPDEGLVQRVLEIEHHLGVGGKGPKRHVDISTAAGLQAPVKRKRGRPRKIQPRMDTTDDCASNAERENTPAPGSSAGDLTELDLSLPERIKRIEEWIIRIEDNDPQLALSKFSVHRELKREMQLQSDFQPLIKVKLSNPVPTSSLAPAAVLRAAATPANEDDDADYDEEAEATRLSTQGAQMDKRIQQLREKLLKSK